MHKAKKMCLSFGKHRLPNFHVNPGFSGKLFTVEQRQKMLDLVAKNREMLMSFRAKSKDKGVTHESSETNRSVCTTHERNETEGNTKTSSQLLAMEQVLDNEFKYGKQADERIHVLNTNSNSPSLVIKEQSENDSKAEEETVQKESKNQEYRKDTDENKDALDTNRNSPSLVMKEQSQNDSKAKEETVQKESKNQSKYRKDTDENKDALDTNRNSPSLVIKEQSENDSKAGQDTVQKDDALNTNNDRQELEHNDLAADMIQNIINSQEQCSEGEIELGAHYSMSEKATMNIQVLANLATEGKVQWM